MKSVLRSAKPYWIYLILTGKKKIEVGKDFPKSQKWNKIVEMYCSKDKKSFNRIPEKDREWMRKYLGKVACQFVCDWIKEIEPHCDIDGQVNQYISHYPAIIGDNCMSFQEMKAYLGCKKGYDWHISDLKIYDKPKELSEFKNYVLVDYYCGYKVFAFRPITRPPQSWCYVEE